MPITFSCPACQTTYKVDDKHAGRTTKCQRCNTAIIIPDELAAVDQYKTCPFCAERVLSEARKCRHCGETIDVALRAAEEAKRIAEKQPATPMVFMNAGGASAASSSSAATGSRRGYARDDFATWHMTHLILTVITCGAWLPVWIIHWIIWSFTR
jgi:predicted Zn finger-like uncharacterized protein